nr:reverse transcriptase domain-containing protein [Tanacetum cinerariifolium]
MLQAPIEGYEDAIVVPPINANNFELKQTLINLVQSNQFTGRQDPHNHLRFFNKVTSTFRHPEVPNTTVKLLLFPFSLEGEAIICLDKEPPRSILTWEDLAPIEGYEDAIIVPPINANNFELKQTLINLVQSNQFTGRQDPHNHLRFFNKVTSTFRHPEDALDSAAGGNILDKIPRECLSIIESKSKDRYSRSRVTDSQLAVEGSGVDEPELGNPEHNKLVLDKLEHICSGFGQQLLRHRDTINGAAGGTFMKRRPEECYDLIENMTAHHNDWDTSAQRSESSSSTTSSSDTEIVALKAEMAKINKNLMRVLQVNQQVKAATPNCETCGGPHSFNDYPTTVGQTLNIYAARAYQGNTVTNPKEELKGITTRSETTYQGPTIPTTSSSLPPVVERKTEATKDTVHPTNNGGTKDVQPLVIQTESPILNSKPVVAPIIELVVARVSAPKPNQKLLIPYPSRLHDQKLRDKANDQKEKFF